MSMAQTISGRCECAAVRYDVAGPVRKVVYCHCEQCRRTSGHYVAATACATGDLRLIADDGLRWYESSAIAERGFCGNCGASLTYQLMKPEESDFLVFCTASLDTPEEFAPTWHAGVESQMPWLDLHDDLPRTRCDDSKSLQAAWESAGVRDPRNWKEVGALAHSH